MDIDAFILIGGRSSRLGSHKAFIELGGETLAGRAANTVEAALSPRHLRFVAASPDQFKDRVPFFPDGPIVVDLKAGFGAWSGLHAALAYAQTEWAYVLACDLPFITAEFVQFLSGKIDRARDAVAPIQQDGRPQPLCAFYRVKAVLSMIEVLIDGRNSLPPLGSILENIGTTFVGPDDYAHLQNAESMFVNINTKHDLDRATDLQLHETVLDS